MDTQPLHGVVHSNATGNLVHLPLEQVNINAFLLDVSAQVTLRQQFSNPSESATGRAKYVFPVPARAAVCAFEMRFADGRVITGVSKERQQASHEYETSLQQGKAAALVDWVTDGLFTISIGSIPPRQTVTAKLILVMDLMDDELKDQIRLLFPIFMACRYGQQPDALDDAALPSTETRLRITVDIQMSGAIDDVSSPSHSITKHRHITSKRQISRRRMVAKFWSPTFLTQNFVLTVRADGLDAPRCFAERDIRDSGFIALQLTMVPKFKLPPIPMQEYIFLVDQSGSMHGDSIKTAKHTLSLLLRMLPNAQTRFNIFSFGNNCHSLWSASQGYSDDTLRAANSHILSMDANYGGTELEKALNKVFNERNTLIPTLVFVLTDGLIDGVDPILRTVRLAVGRATPDAPLRVFSLGIGEHVTTEVVEGIAREGRGECHFAIHSESIVGKCSKLLRAGRSSFLEEISIDWGIPERRRATSTYAPFSVDLGSLHVQLEPPPTVQQMPHQIMKIYPGTRFVAFALTTQKGIPQEVILRGRLNGEHERIEITIPVSRVRLLRNANPEISLIHTLAARRLITDLEEGRAPLPTALNLATPEEDIRKAAIVRLGVEYQLASRYTSFVAVDDGMDASVRPPRYRRRDFDSGPRTSRARTRSGDNQMRASPTSHYFSPRSSLGSIMNFGVDVFTSVFSIIFGGGGAIHRGPQSPRGLPGAYSPSSSLSSLTPGPIGNPPGPNEEEDYDSTDTFSTLSTLESRDSDWSSDRPSFRPPRDEDRSPSPDIDVQGPPANDPQRQTTQRQQPPPAPVPREVLDLVQLQHYNGCFDLDDALGRIVGAAALQKPADAQADDRMWATAVAVAYLRKHLALDGLGDLLDGLLDKVMESIDETMKVQFEGWVAQASRLVN